MLFFYQKNIGFRIENKIIRIYFANILCHWMPQSTREDHDVSCSYVCPSIVLLLVKFLQELIHRLPTKAKGNTRTYVTTKLRHFRILKLVRSGLLAEMNIAICHKWLVTIGNVYMITLQPSSPSSPSPSSSSRVFLQLPVELSSDQEPNWHPNGVHIVCPLFCPSLSLSTSCYRPLITCYEVPMIIWLSYHHHYYRQLSYHHVNLILCSLVILIRSLIKNYLLTHRLSFRAATQCFLLKCLCCHLDRVSSQGRDYA